MVNLLLSKAMPAATAVVGAVMLSVWLSAYPAVDVEPRLPGADGAPDETAVEVTPVERVAKLVKGEGQPADLPGAWPRFRGADFDNVAKEAVPLARQWPEGGPEVLWQIEVGEGYAGAAVLNGRVYLLDYDREQQADALRCLSLAGGKEIWRYFYTVPVRRYHGMSRTVPAVTDEHVVSLGPKCHVTCLDATSGELRWQLDLVKDFGTTVPEWYAGQCPLIDGDRAILAPGGPEALLMAVDCRTGEVAWRTPNPDGWLMTHSSIMPMELAGRRSYVYCASEGVVGVSAEDGRLLWKYPGWTIRMANVPSPVIVGDGRLLFTGDYNSGSLMLRLKAEGDRLVPEPLFRLSPKEFDSRQQTPIPYQEHLYAVRSDGQLVCASLDGKVMWESGPAHRFGLGPYLIANGLLFVMSDEAELTLAEAGPDGFRPLAQATILERAHEAWGPMALVGGRLIVRDMTRMVCLDVRAK